MPPIEFFFGLDPLGKPIYLDGSLARLNKVIPAATRAGKGVCVQMLTPQFALAGDGVFIWDPKRDSKMPRALASFCEKEKIPFQVIDLRYDAPPQICLFENLNERQIFMMMSAGFDLADSGEMDRVYRLEDRQAALATAELAISSNTRALPDLARIALTQKSIASAKVFSGFLSELAKLPSISAKNGFDMESPFKNGGMVYVMGDPLDPVVKMAQKMLLVRVLMQIYQRPHLDTSNRHICIVLDEGKHILTPPACDALGMMQDYKGHAMILFQSMGDLASIPGVDEKTARGAILDNCKLKMVFQSQNHETATWASEETCTEKIYSQSSDKSHDADRSPGNWQEGEAHAIHTNVFKTMPPLTAALIVGGRSRIVHVSPLQQLMDGQPPLFKDATCSVSLAEQPVEANLI